MKTTEVAVENLCVPCACRCAYCLLSYSGRPVGVDYMRGRRFAERFFAEIQRERPELHRTFYIGYAMDGPNLPDYVRFCRSIGSPSGEFLQFNGLRIRDRAETARLAMDLADLGIRSVDMTFYGLRECHDRFARRPGDFDFLLRLMEELGKAGIGLHVSLPLLRDNLGDAEALLDVLSKYPVGQYFAFLPHCQGRGWALRDRRLTRREFEALPERVRACFSPRVEYRTEGEWLQGLDTPEPESRALTLSLTPETIDRLEGMGASAILAELEAMDDRAFAAIPAPSELAALYGDPEGERMYRLRDLLLECRRLWYQDHGAGLPDMDDERGCFSVRV